MAGKSQAAVPFDIVNSSGNDGDAGTSKTDTPGNRSPGHRRVITADITINGHRIGEYAEALIDQLGAPKLDTP